MAEKKQRITTFLKRNNLDENTVTKSIYEKLLLVDEAIEKRLKAVQDARQIEVHNKISISAIAKDTGISNKTFYNNPLLKDYVESFSEEDDIKGKDYDALRERNEFLSAQVKKMAERDVDTETLRHQVRKLTDELHDADLRYQTLEQRFEKLYAERQQSAEIIEFPKPRLVKQSDPSKLSILSWNVRGLHACNEKGGLSSALSLNTDIVCLQEIQLRKIKEVETILKQYSSGKDYVINLGSDTKFKAGVLILSNRPILSKLTVLPDDPIPDEGRFAMIELDTCYIVNVYVPALTTFDRLNIKLTWWQALENYIVTLSSTKPVILCGDMNATVSDIDVGVIPNSPGCLIQEQDMLRDLLSHNFVDIYRNKFPNDKKFTWVGTGGSGMRMDYFFTSKSLADKAESIKIADDIHTSDHFPIIMTVSAEAKQTN